MKFFISILVIFLSSICNSKSQSIYLLDSITTLSIFNETEVEIYTSKYEYDEANKLILESFEYLDKKYEYLNQYDYIKSYISKPSMTANSRIKYIHDDKGFIRFEYGEYYDFYIDSFRLISIQLFEYDEYNRLIKEERYTIDNLGMETLTFDKTITYNEFGIEEELILHYNNYSTVPYQTISNKHFYKDGLVDFSSYESAYDNQLSSWEKDYSYDEDILISTEQRYFSEEQLISFHLNNYEYTQHGNYQFLYIKAYENSEYKLFSTLYSSEKSTPFFEKDTIRTQYHFEDIILEESNFNSVHYSASEDTAIVRKELRHLDFQNLEISKEIHIRINEEVDSLNEEEIIAELFPNPLSVGSFINIKLIDSTINKYEIFNTIGQRIELGSIWSENMQIKSPEIPGQYYIRFFQNNQMKGKIISFSVF